MINPNIADNPVKVENAPDSNPCWHVFANDDILAVNAALVTGRPLLLKGEPGTGKSQLAYAAAAQLDRVVVSHVISANTQLEDLLWRVDVVGRLSEAQVLQQGGDTAVIALDKFIRPGPLWRAFDPASAAALSGDETEVAQAKQDAGRGCVLLLDEIDKADGRLPNGLLESLGNRCFQMEATTKRVIKQGEVAPLIIVTTNGDRQLPAPFLRRCLVHTLSYPDDDKPEEFAQWFKQRAAPHWEAMGETAEDEALQTAVDLILQDRCNGRVIKPGFAEYLDLLRAYSGLRQHDDRDGLLKELSSFVVDKQGQ